MPLRAGRDVSDADGPDAPLVAVVSESFARRHWPGEGALGKRFNVAFADMRTTGCSVTARCKPEVDR